MRKTVAFGFVGTVLDYAGRGSQRWSKWRPSLCLCQQESLVINRLELLHDARSRSLFETLKRDIASVSPETKVVGVEIELHNPWDFEEVYACLHDFARGYVFEPDKEDYLIHITTGTHVAQICWFLLAEARYLPARLIQSSPPRKKEQPRGAGEVTIIDLDLSRYNAIASRFAEERQQTLDFLKSGIATRNAHFNRMIEQIEKVAIKSRAPILLNGPTGAGKSFLARRIFELKQARHQFSGAFVEVNCATLRGDTAMSALFGHVKGAFTGARESREGLLDTVEDEINRLRYNWQESRPSTLTALLGTEAENIDLFDRMQLENVIAVCRQAKSLSAAGRQLFDVSRQGKASVNDADRLRKYLARFGLTWETMQDQHSSS
ncbi:TPA: RNA repair transcriptional activator RtcR family protein [Escherichia coli]